ncbi:hypothetical protein Leryth_012686 [Lithospermum erythrorhizon]|nr:hypothetical protein Leryth_012686 [Lithospermum erythrorhizon]
MNQLYVVMYEFNFSLPPDYALVIRALGSLEGTAKVLDPEFKVVESAYPFVIGRLLADPNPDMRQILRELLIRNDGTIRWNRLERLIAAISQQATETTSQEYSSPLEWKSFNMRAVVSATEDLFHFVLSKEGSVVRIFLLRDIIKAADAILDDELLPRILDDKFQGDPFGNEGRAMVLRVISGFESFWTAVRLAPELWSAMLVRLLMTQEFLSFAFEIVSALWRHSGDRIPETFWVCTSRLIHRLSKEN